MSIGEYINHYHTVRISVLGEGIFKQSLLSLPDKDGAQAEYVLPTVNMYTLGRKPSNTLANAKEFAVQLELKTTEINEYFVVTRIIVYMLPTETGVPG